MTHVTGHSTFSQQPCGCTDWVSVANGVNIANTFDFRFGTALFCTEQRTECLLPVSTLFLLRHSVHPD